METASETRCLDALAMMNWLVESINNLFLHYPGYCTDRLLVYINLSGGLTLPRTLQTIHTFSGNLTIDYFFIHPLRVIGLDWKPEREPLYSAQATQSKNTKMFGQYFSLHFPRCCNSIRFCPEQIRLAACPAFNLRWNGKVVQSTDVHHFSLALGGQNNICFINFPALESPVLILWISQDPFVKRSGKNPGNWLENFFHPKTLSASGHAYSHALQSLAFCSPFLMPHHTSWVLHSCIPALPNYNRESHCSLLCLRAPPQCSTAPGYTQ